MIGASEIVRQVHGHVGAYNTDRGQLKGLVHYIIYLEIDSLRLVLERGMKRIQRVVLWPILDQAVSPLGIIDMEVLGMLGVLEAA